jgi:hypothetical protein
MDGDLENIVSREKYYNILLDYVQKVTDDYKGIKKIMDGAAAKGTAGAFDEMVAARPRPKERSLGDGADLVGLPVNGFHLMDIQDIEKVIDDIDDKLKDDEVVRFYGYDSPNKITDALINVCRAFNDVVLNHSMTIKEFQRRPSYYKSRYDWINLFKLFGFLKIGEIMSLDEPREFVATFKKQKKVVTIRDMNPSRIRAYARGIKVGDKTVGVEKLRREILHGRRAS